MGLFLAFYFGFAWATFIGAMWAAPSGSRAEADHGMWSILAAMAGGMAVGLDY